MQAGGETEAQPSAWTIDSVRQYMADMVKEVDRRYEQRFEEQQRAMLVAFTAQEKALTAALDSQNRYADTAAGNHERAKEAAFNAAKATLDAMDRRYDQRFEAQEHAVTLALSRVDKEFHEHLRAAREETQAALTAADKAIGKSEVAAEKRFESVNEFRGQQGDIVATFIPRTEAEQRIAQNIEKIDSIEKRMTQAFASMGSRLDIAQGSKQGYAQLIGFIFGAVGVVAALIGVAIALR